MATSDFDGLELVRAIASSPEARTELVRLVVGGELIQVRESLSGLDERMGELAAAQARTDQRMGELAAAQARTEQAVNRLSGGIGQVLGEVMENRFVLYARSQFSQIAFALEEVPPADLKRMLRNAESAGHITHEQLLDAHRADLVLQGTDVISDDEITLVIEVSSVVDSGDVERADRRAAVLRAAGRDAVAVVAGSTITSAAAVLASELGTWRVVNGQAIPPAA